MTTNDTNRFADALLRAVQGTVFNTTLRKGVGDGTLDYEVYLKTDELLATQTPYDALVAPDELLFQIVHQTQELWMKQLAFESVTLVRFLDAGKLTMAFGTLHRMFVIARGLGDQIRILQSLPPDVFQTIRRQLGNGSGLESPGYNRFNVAADGMRAAFLRWCEARSVRPIDLYLEPEKNVDSHRLAEAFLDLDEAVQTWLVSHYMLVRRTIGVAKSVKALDGFPTVLLASRMTRPLFPELWDIRIEMTETWNRAGGYRPGEARASATSVHSVSGTHPAAVEVDSDRETAAGPPSTRTA